MERVALKNPIVFFDEILLGRSLKWLSKKIKINYSTLKHWRRGDYLIPYNRFLILLEEVANKKYWINQVSIKPENWGCSKGGETTVSRLSKTDLNRKLKKARSKIQWKPPTPMKIAINENFCEFYGTLIGDGCLSKFKRWDWGTRRAIIISGHKQLDRDYHENFLLSLIRKEFNLNAYIYRYKNHNSRVLIIQNSSLFATIAAFGFPIGKKGNLKIPKELLDTDWKCKRAIIRGIFDIDGCIAAKKNEGYKYPYIIITSKSKPLIRQIYKLLKEQNYPCYIKRNKKELRIKGIKNTIKWMNDIGTSNWRHLVKYKYWLRNTTLPANINWARSSVAECALGLDSK